MRGAFAMILCFFLVSACSFGARTDAELTGQAQEAVDRKLGQQATFSLMESTVTQQIVCGHAAIFGAIGQQQREQDFVYKSGRVIMEDDPDFDTAALQCDEASEGMNYSSAAAPSEQ